MFYLPRRAAWINDCGAIPMLTTRTLVGFGASTMQGVGDSQGGFFKRIQPALSATYPGLRFINHGVGGNTTQDMLNRAEQTAALGAYDLVVILGCNDMPRNNGDTDPKRLPPDRYEANLKQLLATIRGRRSLFISSFPVRVVSRAIFDDYMPRAVRVAREAGYEIWDLYAELRNRDLTSLWASDGVHFNDAGHQLIADGVLARL